MLESGVLTALAGVWRWVDGRGIPPITWMRNVVGAIVSAASAIVGLGLTWQAGVCASIAWLTLIAGYTKWESLPFSVVRYGLPTILIGILLSLTSPAVVPIAPFIIYALGGVLIGIIYYLFRSVIPDFGRNQEVCEVLASAFIIGGLAWL